MGFLTIVLVLAVGAFIVWLFRWNAQDEKRKEEQQKAEAERARQNKLAMERKGNLELQLDRHITQLAELEFSLKGVIENCFGRDGSSYSVAIAKFSEVISNMEKELTEAKTLNNQLTKDWPQSTRVSAIARFEKTVIPRLKEDQAKLEAFDKKVSSTRRMMDPDSYGKPRQDILQAVRDLQTNKIAITVSSASNSAATNHIDSSCSRICPVCQERITISFNELKNGDIICPTCGMELDVDWSQATQDTLAPSSQPTSPAEKTVEFFTPYEYVCYCEKALDEENLTKIYNIDAQVLLQCLWHFAMEKNLSSDRLRMARNVFMRVWCKSTVKEICSPDLGLSDYYAKMQVGGEDAIREPLRDFLKFLTGKRENEYLLAQLASGLMWMKAYQSEQTVLQYMLSKGFNMSAKLTERLHALSSNGGKAPSGYDVVSTEKSFYFDVSALAWKDEEYTGLFDNLAFQDKALTYALAVRDEDKDLFIAQGIRMPSAGALEEKLSAVFADEYDGDASVRRVSCTALSGSGEEHMDAILATAAECPQLGILLHTAKAGKKLVIKFYTLFIPAGTDLAAQKQQALSMHKKLSPAVSIWEGSLKDTMLLAVQQLLNSENSSAVQNGSKDTVEF